MDEGSSGDVASQTQAEAQSRHLRAKHRGPGVSNHLPGKSGVSRGRGRDAYVDGESAVHVCGMLSTHNCSSDRIRCSEADSGSMLTGRERGTWRWRTCHHARVQ